MVEYFILAKVIYRHDLNTNYYRVLSLNDKLEVKLNDYRTSDLIRLQSCGCKFSGMKVTESASNPVVDNDGMSVRFEIIPVGFNGGVKILLLKEIRDDIGYYGVYSDYSGSLLVLPHVESSVISYDYHHILYRIRNIAYDNFGSSSYYKIKKYWYGELGEASYCSPEVISKHSISHRRLLKAKAVGYKENSTYFHTGPEITLNKAKIEYLGSLVNQKYQCSSKIREDLFNCDYRLSDIEDSVHKVSGLAKNKKFSTIGVPQKTSYSSLQGGRLAYYDIEADRLEFNGTYLTGSAYSGKEPTNPIFINTVNALMMLTISKDIFKSKDWVKKLLRPNDKVLGSKYISLESIMFDSEYVMSTCDVHLCFIRNNRNFDVVKMSIMILTRQDRVVYCAPVYKGLDFNLKKLYLVKSSGYDTLDLTSIINIGTGIQRESFMTFEPTFSWNQVQFMSKADREICCTVASGLRRRLIQIGDYPKQDSVHAEIGGEVINLDIISGDIYICRYMTDLESKDKGMFVVSKILRCGEFPNNDFYTIRDNVITPKNTMSTFKHLVNC